jgi:DNA-directed RNA polymerase specialized sigma24 family protein
MEDDSEPPRRKGPGSPVWVNEFDSEGRRADPAFIKAVLKIGSDLLLYRATELQDESLARQLLEEAVHNATRSRNGQAVDNPEAYLATTYRNRVDEEIERSHKFVPLDERVLYRRIDSLPGPNYNYDEDIERRRAIGTLAPLMQEIAVGLLLGWTIRELADQMSKKPDALYQQLSRFRRKRKNALDGTSTKAPLSGPDAKPNVGPSRAQRASSPRGRKRAA